MKRGFKLIEWFVDQAIPYLLIVLLILIILEVFYHETAVKYHEVIEIADYAIITFFVADLGFKLYRVRNVPRFLKKYWLEIIAVFPFFLVFRLLERFAGLYFAAQDLVLPQKILHEGVEAEKLAKEARLARESRLVKLIRPIARSSRLLKFADKKTEKNFEKTIEKHERIIEKGTGIVNKRLKMALHFYSKP